MRPHPLFFLAVAALCSLTTRSAAHPGSGIVVDQQGNVYFTHTGRGCAKIDLEGKLSYIHESRGGHWMCLDAEGSFSRSQPEHFERITPDGMKPSLIFADGGSPIAVLRDGQLYYASNDDTLTPGGLQVTRQSPDRKIAPFPADGKRLTEPLGITGLAAGPEGALYIASPRGVSRLDADGKFTILAHPIELKDCDVDYPDHNPNSPLPSLRGLAVDEDGTVFAAAVGCRAVVKVSKAGTVKTVLKAEAPWSPTGVAVNRGAVFSLEYTNANGSHLEGEGWLPRVRKLNRDGTVTTVVTVASETGKTKKP